MVTLQFEFYYKRAHLFAESVLVAPLVLIAIASNSVYLIPPESDDRMGFITTNILTMFVLLALIDQKLPSTVHFIDAPLILCIFWCAIVLFSIQFIVIIASGKIVRWDFNIPKWIQNIFKIKIDSLKCSIAQKPSSDGNDKNSNSNLLRSILYELRQIRVLVCKQSMNHEG